MSQPTQLQPAVVETLLTTAVKMSLVDSSPKREEASLSQIARRLGELGEIRLMTDLYSHIERFQTCLGMLHTPPQ